MEQKIVSFIKNQYNPLAIILYGSRAIDGQGVQSDWDIVCLVEGESRSDSFIFENQFVDLDLEHYPFDPRRVIKVFDGTLQNAKLLDDTNGVGKKFLTEIHAMYALGRNLTPAEVSQREQFFRRRLLKLQQSIGNPTLFSIHLGVFLEKATQYWYEVIKNRWRTSLRSRLVVIQSEDPGYFTYLAQLSSSIGAEEKLILAEQVVDTVFQKQ